jgi:O-antigen/teichoic acid export membrane protein
MSSELFNHVPPHEAACGQALAPRLAARIRQLLSRFPVVSHGLLSIADQAIVSATSFATMVVIGRATSPAQLGLYCLVMSIVYISVGVQDQIVAMPFTIYSKRHHGRDLDCYSGSVWVHQLVLIALGMLVLLAAIAGLWLAGAVDLQPGMLALLSAGPFLLLREWIRRFVYARLQIVPAVAIDAFVAVAQLGGLLLLWRLQSLTILSIFAVMGAACAIACLGWFALDRPKIRFEPSRYKSDWLYNWSFARWALQSYVAGSVLPFVMPWMLVMAVGIAAAGAFGASNALINIANVFLISVDRVLTPHAAQAFAHGRTAALRRVLSTGAWVMLPPLGAFCLLVFGFGSQLAVFVYGDQFSGNGPTLIALAVAMFMNGVGMVAGTGLWSIDQPRANFVADVCCLLATLVAAAFLIRPFGAFGAALAILVGTTTAALVRSITLARCLETVALESDVVVNAAHLS